MNQESVFDELGKEMGRVNSDLTFEFGPVPVTCLLLGHCTRLYSVPVSRLTGLAFMDSFRLPEMRCGAGSGSGFNTRLFDNL